jgi:hypothetical protein
MNWIQKVHFVGPAVLIYSHTDIQPCWYTAVLIYSCTAVQIVSVHVTYSWTKSIHLWHFYSCVSVPEVISVWVTKLSLNDRTVLWGNMYLEEINSDYSSINPNKMIHRINWKDHTGKVTLTAGILRNLLIFWDKGFVVCQELFSVGAKPAYKLEVTTSQTSYEIRQVQPQMKRGLWIVGSIQASYVIKCHAEGRITASNRTAVCVHVYQHTQRGDSGMEHNCSYREHWPIVTLLCCYG